MNIRQLLFRLIVAFLAFHLFMILVPISPVALMIGLLLCGLTACLDHRNGFVLVITLVVVTAIMEMLARAGGSHIPETHYRAHELLSKETRFAANQHVELTQKHGDLLAIDPSLDRALAQPRPIVFTTDSLGFRNDRDRKPTDLIIVGDSFVVGTGNTQRDILVNALSTNFNIPSYSMSFPGDSFQYANNIEAARNELGESTCVVAVIFDN